MAEVEIKRLFSADEPLADTIIIAIPQESRGYNDPLVFWKHIDKAAEKLGINPFCPCGERPHKISCPLGFHKYFPHRLIRG